MPFFRPKGNDHRPFSSCLPVVNNPVLSGIIHPVPLPIILGLLLAQTGLATVTLVMPLVGLLP